jgi:diguanylate cyclase (GGDEF)-like protein
MRVIGRQDTSLVVGLILSALVMVAQPLRTVLDIADDVGRTHHLDLIPALIVLVLILALHEQRKQNDAAEAARVASRGASDAAERVLELQMLVAASETMTQALDWEALKRGLWEHIHAFTDERDVWVGVDVGGHWKLLVDPIGAEGRFLLELAPTLLRLVLSGERRHNSWALFPLNARDSPIGLLAVKDDIRPLSPTEQMRLSTLARVAGIAARNIQTLEEMRNSSVSDVLTGCHNRAYAFAALEAELRRARRTHRPVSIVMIDLDGFKGINDQHGHVCGDALLAAIGDTLRRSLRMSDTKSRYGGDEFLLILPETNAAGADQVGEHVRRAVERVEAAGKAAMVSCRVSVGAATSDGADGDVTNLVGRADAALYEDKRRGPHRLRLIASGEEPRA